MKKYSSVLIELPKNVYLSDLPPFSFLLIHEISHMFLCTRFQGPILNIARGGKVDCTIPGMCSNSNALANMAFALESTTSVSCQMDTYQIDGQLDNQ